MRGSAICADLGSRTIREELDAMEVMGVSRCSGWSCPGPGRHGRRGPAQRPGLRRRHPRRLLLQRRHAGRHPGAYLSSFSALAQLPDLYVSELKALVFGFIAGIVAAYRGLNPRGGPKGVGDAVNQSVVITFLLLFFVNMVMTAVYLQIVPPKGG